jgi:hypothetical protein
LGYGISPTDRRDGFLAFAKPNRTILPVNTIYGFCVYLQILEQTLYLSSFDSKGTPELGKL